MKILIVAAYNKAYFAPFILEQAVALEKQGVEIGYFGIVGNGISGYLKNRQLLIKKINEFQPDVLHAHFGLSGLLSNLQRKVPVVTTYHGCDINKSSLRKLSYLSLSLDAYSIFVSKKQLEKLRYIPQSSKIIPCGIDFDKFYPQDKIEARKTLGLSENKKYVLFSGAFDRPEKNAILAQDAIKLLNNVELVELKGFSREEMLLWMNACDVGLLTSVREGSPMFIKELLACNRPIVSTDVGDVRENIADIKGCYIVPFDKEAVAKAVSEAFQYENTVVPNDFKNQFDNNKISEKLIEIYTGLL